MDDYQKAAVRSWCFDHAIQLNKGRRAPVSKVLRDAKLVHKFIADLPAADVLKLTDKEEKR